MVWRIKVCLVYSGAGVRVRDLRCVCVRELEMRDIFMFRPLVYIHSLRRPQEMGMLSNSAMDGTRMAFAAAPISTAIQAELDERPTYRCTICNEVLGLPRLDGQVETAVILPCSHIFGSICITRWLEKESVHQDCPNCRRKMIYRDCGHTIKPCEVERAPKAVSEEDMPEKCGICRGEGLLENQLRLARERQLAEERALVGMSIQLPGIFGTFCRTSIQSVDSRIVESREFWKREIDALYAELQQKHREVW